MTRLSKNTKEIVKGLATAYQAYVSALYQDEGADRDLTLSVWGKILIDRQRDLGIEMLEPNGLAIVIERADARQTERRRIAA